MNEKDAFPPKKIGGKHEKLKNIFSFRILHSKRT